MSLALSEKSHFLENGYLLAGEIFSPAEVSALRDVYMASLERLKAEGKYQSIRKSSGEEKPVYQIRAAHLYDAAFKKIIEDARILDKVESLIGPNIRLVLMQGLYKPPFTGGVIGWHQDDYYFRVNKPNAVVSAWLTLDDVDEKNGCMWVIPRAHHGLVSHVPTENKDGVYIPDADESRAVPLRMKAGEIMFHHGATPHRTLANESERPRRALAMHFMDAGCIPLGEGRAEEPVENMPLLRGTGLSW